MMKKTIFSFALGLLLCVSAFAQDRADRLHLYDKKSFSMIVMGDPQNYTRFDINQPIYELCTAWCADNIENLNIKAVLMTGDMVDQNENFIRKRGAGNQTSKQMWEWTSHCMARLDNKVPYVISPGNHEYGYTRGDEPFTHFPEYFTVERNCKTAQCLVAAYPNRMGKASLENSAYVFKDKKWGNLLLVTTEWAPRDEVLDWVRNLCQSEKYKDYRVIFMTHSYLKHKTAAYTVRGSYKIEPGNFGEDIWKKLIKVTPNIRLVVCGHTGTPGGFDDNVAFRVDKNDAGKNVSQMMFNVQFLAGGGSSNGGDGWLRILEFMPNGKTIKVRTYSPLFAISPTTKHLANRTESYDQFDITID